MMRILFVFTGGTIGSTLGIGGVIAPEAKKAYKIIEAYSRRYALDFEYDMTEPYTELSENNTGEHIKKLVECVKERLADDYDGIIVTHGTDTLQYSAAALGYALGKNTPPVCIVSANKPIEDQESNALVNLHGAVCLIKEKLGRGVFVTYRNTGADSVFVHRATRLVGSTAFSDNVASVFDSVYGHFDKDFAFVKNERYAELDDAVEALCVERLTEASENIRVISPYVGMTYLTLDDKVKYILLNTYHSGTVNTRSQSAREYFLGAKRRGIKVYAVGVTKGPEYMSASLYGELGITPIYNISPVAAYVKLWLLSLTDNEPTDALRLSLGSDIVP